MTYQGERARPMATEIGRCFEVTKIRIGADGHVSEVLWCEVDAALDREVHVPVVAAAAEVVDALHDGARVEAVFGYDERLPKRAFVVVEHEDGRECIALEGADATSRNVSDMDGLDD